MTRQAKGMPDFTGRQITTAYMNGYRQSRADDREYWRHNTRLSRTVTNAVEWLYAVGYEAGHGNAAGA